MSAADGVCSAGRAIYEAESGTTYVVWKHRDDRSPCAHPVHGAPSADEHGARWLTDLVPWDR